MVVGDTIRIFFFNNLISEGNNNANGIFGNGIFNGSLND